MKKQKKKVILNKKTKKKFKKKNMPKKVKVEKDIVDNIFDDMDKKVEEWSQ